VWTLPRSFITFPHPDDHTKKESRHGGITTKTEESETPLQRGVFFGNSLCSKIDIRQKVVTYLDVDGR